jgi:hypothetical protein
VGSLPKDNVIDGGKMKMALQQTGAARRNSEPTDVGFGSLRRVASAATEGMPVCDLIRGQGKDPAMFLTHKPKHESSSCEFLIFTNVLNGKQADHRWGGRCRPLYPSHYPTVLSNTSILAARQALAVREE